MDIDIIDLEGVELETMPAIRQKLIRTAQKNKNELWRKVVEQLAEYEKLLLANDTFSSTLMESMTLHLEGKFYEDVEILREQLLFNLELNEPTNGDETGGGSMGDTGEGEGYLVDYELSYLERYVLVRDYYLSIEDGTERMNLYRADYTARSYLGSYYNALYDYMNQLS